MDGLPAFGKCTMKTTSAKPVIVAAAVAIGLMAAGGVAYRVLVTHLARPTDSVPLSMEDLAELPMQLESWRGRDVPLAEAVIRATGTDAHVSRKYKWGSKSVGLFLAYGVRTRDLLPHRPTVCYPGIGYTLKENDDVILSLPNGDTLPCRVFQFDHGGLGQQSMTVLNYYIVDDQYSPDVELLRWKRRIRYVAQVQIYCGGDDPAPGALAQSVREFASDSALAIRALFQDRAPIQEAPQDGNGAGTQGVEP